MNLEIGVLLILDIGNAENIFLSTLLLYPHHLDQYHSHPILQFAPNRYYSAVGIKKKHAAFMMLFKIIATGKNLFHL